MEFDKYMSLYCEAKTAGAELNQDVKDYIDDRIEDSEKAGGRYNVVPSFQKGRLLVIDIDSGSVIGNIDPQGKLISVPVVYGDEVSFAVQDDAGRVNGTVRRLPDGAITNQFRVGEPKPGMKFREVMGKEDQKSEEEDDELALEPEEVPDSSLSELPEPVLKDTSRDIDEIVNRIQTTGQVDEIDIEQIERDVIDKLGLENETSPEGLKELLKLLTKSRGGERVVSPDLIRLLNDVQDKIKQELAKSQEGALDIKNPPTDEKQPPLPEPEDIPAPTMLTNPRKSGGLQMPTPPIRPS